MADDILRTIDSLVAEEHRLREQAPGTGLAPADRARLQVLEQRLDQCWDLLRRRRAGADQGEDPEQVEPRPVAEVESYQQ
ncbi:DUF2630 family protein [Streptomyces sp. NBC_01498]|uniref:DUF2630 family protein n=1 Tax=Streptomyces sp. NBC_01498 TaxID=2975870 RepID=UPI002E7C2EA5|nr:DUF2630 family protein [Streptomyces sp. NBC_01498]WTL28542.1 DUF2630 family protein [Streptomyces sp. NBC_01498]